MTADRLERAAADDQKEEARHEGGPQAKVFQGLFYVAEAATASPTTPRRRKRPKGATDRQIASVALSRIYAHTNFCLANGLDVDPDAVVFAIAVMLGAGGPPTSYWLGRGLSRRLVQWNGLDLPNLKDGVRRAGLADEGRNGSLEPSCDPFSDDELDVVMREAFEWLGRNNSKRMRPTELGRLLGVTAATREAAKTLAGRGRRRTSAGAPEAEGRGEKARRPRAATGQAPREGLQHADRGRIRLAVEAAAVACRRRQPRYLVPLAPP